MTTALDVSSSRTVTAIAAQNSEAALHPANLHLSVMCAASGIAPLRERVEQKFFVLPPRIGQAFALLRRTCRAEAAHPAGQVSSLYFDTPDLGQHERSLSGEHAKDKVRIRWYGGGRDPHRTGGGNEPGLVQTPAAPGNTAGCVYDRLDGGLESENVEVWLELKSRRGFASTKQRLAVDVAVSALCFSALPRGIVPAAVLARTMAGFGFMVRGAFCPVVVISYQRYRFVEPETGFRVSIDSHIRSSVVMPGIGRGERALELPGAVVEVKGPVFDLPRALRPLADIGAAWTRYSKYSSSLEGHRAAGGSVSRLWPSGVLALSDASLV